MNVLYFCSDLFVHVVTVAIISLLENNKKAPSIKIFIIEDGVSKEKQQILLNVIKSYHRELIFIPAPDPNIIFEFKFKSRYQMGHSYMRMCLGTLLPDNIEKVLCLDADTLVLDDIQNLWDLNMEENILAGVADCVNVKAFKRQFLLGEHDIYCNAGMYLINLKKWRENDIEKKIRQTIHQKNGNIFFFEQTLMNYACKGKIIKLPPQYNAYTLFFAFKFKNLIRWRKPTTFYTEKEVNEAVSHPIIIHFTRNFYMMSRPWIKNCDHPMTTAFLRYKKLSPWKELDEDNRPFSKKLRYKLIHIIPQCLLAYSVNILYNSIRPLLYWKNE